MKRHEGDQKSCPHQGRGANLVAEDGGDDDQLQGPSPEVVIEQDSCVKPEKFPLVTSRIVQERFKKPPLKQLILLFKSAELEVV